jgi:indolepyruvate ferredoxin oxidoreductase
LTEPEARRSGIAPDYQLSDRYTADRGKVFMTGLQALARLPIEQLRVDRAAGLRTAAFVSGYPGSPLGGYDLTIARAVREAADLPIVCRPALNEEYAATAVMGSQLAAARPDARYEGVIGIWYGKAPGVDRASDALRHAVYAGSHPRGGAIALVGDDPNAKSSTLPSSSAGSLFDMHVPFLYPGDPGEALDLGRHAIALARCTGLWAGLKIVADVADGNGTVTLDPERIQPTIPLHEGRPYVHVPDGKLLTPHTIELEREIYEVRYALAVEYASQNKLNHATVDPPDAWIGIASSGITYREVREALRRLGLADDAAVFDAGIRLLKLQMPMPFNPVTMRHFARGLRELLVIEEKHPNIESLVKDALYNQAERPLVIGKHDENEERLIRGHGALTADDLLPALRRRLAPVLGARLAPDGGDPAERARGGEPVAVRRTPFYCSGCPHNRSTQVPSGTLVGAGIGCHTMTMLMNPQRVGDIAGLTCMGNEGTQWIGMADFVESDHFVQNLGDGTYFHSGQLAIQAAVAAGVSITYKLLWNGAVAMTGGQPVQGRIELPAVARTLLDQGVARVLVTSDEPARYGAVELPAGVEVWPRERLLEAQQRLASVAGVTVLIHDQACAAELRRARKRGRAAVPARRVAINPRICEGCGDCGRVSGCLSVQLLETPFGRKTTIDQTTCNLDFSCLEGDCPSFMTVTPRPAWQRALCRWLRIDRPSGAGEAPGTSRFATPPALPEPLRARDVEDFSLRITGVGGTGVVTVSQVLGTAAAFDGYEVRGLDQIGLSQKAGPVVGDLRLRRGAPAETNRLGRGQADLILALDPLVAASRTGLDVADPERTAVVGSTHCTPTGAMITQPELELPVASELCARIAAVTREGERHWADAAACTTALLGDAVTANLFVVGMAVEAGCLPIRGESIERAIELNGVAIEANRAAFRWGRTAILDPPRVARAVEAAAHGAARADPAGPVALPPALAERAREAAAGDDAFAGRLALWTRDLVAYQDEELASDYLASVEASAARERAVLPGSSRLAEAVARSLHKLLAYKDEYEVGRLLLDAEGQAPARALARDGGRITWQLQPPLLRVLGLRRKLAIGTWATPWIRALAAARRLRGTPLDPFGWPRIRRIERALPREYRAVVDTLLAHLKPENLDEAASIAALPEEIRGYEELKLARVAEYRQRVAERLAAYRS